MTIESNCCFVNFQDFLLPFLALFCLLDRSLASFASFSAFAFFPFAIMFAISVLFSLPSPSLSWRSKATSIWIRKWCQQNACPRPRGVKLSTAFCDTRTGRTFLKCDHKR